MKKHDLQPTSDNIRNTFIRDSIGRNKDLLYFVKLIDSLEESYSIALDSYWGSGKTFFVKQLKMILDAKTEESYNEVEGQAQVLSTWESISHNMPLKKHVPIYYDAWQNDCDDDPIYSLVYQMILDTENIKGIKDKIRFSDALSVAGRITGAFVGFDPNEIAEPFKKNDFLEALRERKNINKKIEEYIDTLLPKECDRLLIIIDELDRCNPEFAVKLLERIKHYFNNDKVTFVFSVNLAELQHTIKKHYGTKFNASRYLDRFFDFYVTLPEPDVSKYMNLQSLSSKGTYVFDDNLSLVVKKFKLQLREISRLIPMARMVVGDYAYNNANTTRSQAFIVFIFVPVAIALLVTDKEKYRKFVDGSDSSALIDFFDDDEVVANLKYFLSYLFDNDDIPNFNPTSNTIEDFTLLKEKLEYIYKAFFSTNGYKTIAQIRISDKDREFFKRIMSLLSDNAVNSIKK